MLSQERLSEIEAERAAKKLAAHQAAEQKLKEAAMPPRMQLAAQVATHPPFPPFPGAHYPCLTGLASYRHLVHPSHMLPSLYMLTHKARPLARPAMSA